MATSSAPSSTTPMMIQPHQVIAVTSPAGIARRLSRRLPLMSRFSLVLICALLATPLAAQPDAAADPQAAVRTRFLAAYEAAALGTDTADDAALEGYVLYPYVLAARIERELTLRARA